MRQLSRGSLPMRFRLACRWASGRPGPRRASTLVGVQPDDLLDYCLAKPGAFLDFPFGVEVAVVKVKAPSQPSGKIFAQVATLGGVPSATLSCDPATAVLYRQLYPGVVVRGYHCPPVQQPYFNTFPLDGPVTDTDIIELADIAYDAVVAKLPKYRQRELAAASAVNKGGPR
jgi:predicted DNA-binding protein (MmcQ/YjbR family)